MSIEHDSLKKFLSKNYRGTFNDFLDLFDTPTKYTKPNDLITINNQVNGLVFKDPVELLTDLITNNNLSSIKIFKQYFAECNELVVVHDLNLEYPLYKIYTNQNEEIWPGECIILNNNTLKFLFNPSVSGKVIIFGN